MECAPGIAASVKANPDRYYFVNREDAQKVLDHCPDAQWKLIFALADMVAYVVRPKSWR